MPQRQPYNPKVAESNVRVGDYVFATKYSDCDPNDSWAVGFVSKVLLTEDPNTQLIVVVDNSGITIGRSYWKCCQKITKDQGKAILDCWTKAEGLCYSDELKYELASILKGQTMTQQLTTDEKRHRENYRRTELQEALERLTANQERIEGALAETGGSDLALMEVASAIQLLLSKSEITDL